LAYRRPGAAQASQNLAAQRVWTSIVLMSARPEEHGGSHDVIHLGGETAVVIPLDEYRMLAALRDRASADEIEEAEIDAAIAEHEAWKAAGRLAALCPMRLPWLNCSGAASDDRLAARRADVGAPVHGRPGRNAADQPRL